jgi:hypothetical protein
MLKSGTKSMPTKREGMLKNSKASSGEIGVVACEQKKLARPWMEKLDFLLMNSQLMSWLGKGDLDYRIWSNTICWHVCNFCPMWWLEFLSWKFETSSEDERDDGQTRGIWWKTLNERTRWKQKTHLIKTSCIENTKT